MTGRLNTEYGYRKAFQKFVPCPSVAQVASGLRNGATDSGLDWRIASKNCAKKKIIREDVCNCAGERAQKYNKIVKVKSGSII